MRERAEGVPSDRGWGRALAAVALLTLAEGASAQKSVPVRAIQAPGANFGVAGAAPAYTAPVADLSLDAQGRSTLIGPEALGAQIQAQFSSWEAAGNSEAEIGRQLLAESNLDSEAHTAIRQGLAVSASEAPIFFAKTRELFGEPAVGKIEALRERALQLAATDASFGAIFAAIQRQATLDQRRSEELIGRAREYAERLALGQRSAESSEPANDAGSDRPVEVPASPKSGVQSASPRLERPVGRRTDGGSRKAEPPSPEAGRGRTAGRPAAPASRVEPSVEVEGSVTFTDRKTGETARFSAGDRVWIRLTGSGGWRNWYRAVVTQAGWDGPMPSIRYRLEEEGVMVPEEEGLDGPPARAGIAYPGGTWTRHVRPRLERAGSSEEQPTLLQVGDSIDVLVRGPGGWRNWRRARVAGFRKDGAWYLRYVLTGPLAPSGVLGREHELEGEINVSTAWVGVLRPAR